MCSAVDCYCGRPSSPSRQTYTKWHNPLAQDQYVDVHENGRLIRYVVPAGGEEEIPSAFDMAIQRVVCSHPECKTIGGFCRKSHDGVVMMGLAPQLVNMTTKAKLVLNPALDTLKEERVAAEAELASKDVQRQQIENAQVIAAAKLAKSDKK